MIHIGNKIISNDSPCFITFEAGPTHCGLESAKRLVKYAAEAKADAVKFQIIDPDRLVADRKQLFSYEILLDKESGATETISEPLYEILERRTLSTDEWKELKSFSDSLGLAFFATIGFEDEIDFLVKMGCDSIKIASADVNHFPLIRKAAQTGLTLQIDTGNATIGEIEEAVDIIISKGNNNIIIHNCPSGYPAHLESINLNVITTLKQMFPFPIAFSDHTPGWEMDIAAIALGAKLLEKTITENRLTRSVEHVMSLELEDMKEFVTKIKEVEIALGQPRRKLLKEEHQKRLSIRRSTHVKHDLSAEHVLCEEDFEFRRPGYDIPPSMIDGLVGKKLRISKKAGEKLFWSDIDVRKV